MFKPKEYSQSEYEFVSIKKLVPDDHGLRYCQLRGLINVREQALLTPDCQNMKRLKHTYQEWKMCVSILRLICLPVDWSGGHSTPAG
ncbi:MULTISPECIES: hypothetical protein [Neobacillus]|uniref:hypothetical protein n=1 Tax=Neobacillus TaxID=2675232 RepID=UPI00201749E2|nr:MULTISPECIES: hypothetical protein [Neobacillus]